MEEVDIKTTGCNHLQRRNKLKGIAMQKLIVGTIKNKKEDISIKKILESNKEKIFPHYWVHSPFKTSDKSFLKRYELISFLEFNESETIFVKEKIENKEWKRCSYCGQYIKSSLQKTKKCRKCKKGFFRYEAKVFDNWTEIYNGKKEEIIKKLCDAGYIKEIVPNLNKRADFFEYSNGIFYIFESKNKELTELTFGDVIRTIIYPKIIRDCGFKVSELRIIFNGSFGADLEDAIKKGFGEKFDFKINFYPIKKYLEESGIHVKEILITRINGKYNYTFIEGKSEQIIIKIDIPLNK